MLSVICKGVIHDGIKELLRCTPFPVGWWNSFPGNLGWVYKFSGGTQQVPHNKFSKPTSKKCLDQTPRATNKMSWLTPSPVDFYKRNKWNEGIDLPFDVKIAQNHLRDFFWLCQLQNDNLSITPKLISLSLQCSLQPMQIWFVLLQEQCNSPWFPGEHTRSSEPWLSRAKRSCSRNKLRSWALDEDLRLKRWTRWNHFSAYSSLAQLVWPTENWILRSRQRSWTIDLRWPFVDINSWYVCKINWSHWSKIVLLTSRMDP